MYSPLCDNLLYWYNSTNTDSEGGFFFARLVAHEEQLVLASCIRLCEMAAEAVATEMLAGGVSRSEGGRGGGVSRSEGKGGGAGTAASSLASNLAARKSSSKASNAASKAGRKGSQNGGSTASKSKGSGKGFG